MRYYVLNQRRKYHAKIMERTDWKKSLSEYPDQIDGVERLGQVYEARGKRQVAAEYYQKAADFAKKMPDFDQQSIESYLSKV